MYMWGPYNTCSIEGKEGPYLTVTFEAVLKKSYMWRWTIRSYMWGTIRYLFHVRYGQTIRFIDSYKVPTFHIKIWGTIRAIGIYKVPTVDSNHIVHVEGWHVLTPKDWEP